MKAIAKKVLAVASSVVVACSMLLATVPTTALAADGVAMYRLYNPNTGEHFYTSDLTERDKVIVAGWDYEGTGWYAPKSSNTPVYRLYNTYAGDHHYTKDADERDELIARGWTDEGIGWYSDDNETVAVYRQYNPNASAGAHNFTTSTSEHSNLVSRGWTDENIAWYATAEGVSIDNSKAIMGSTKTTAHQMATYYKKIKGSASYPAKVYSSKGAASIEQFCQIVYEEAIAEGVRAEVVFCQAMWETGWLQFGGSVNAAQCNFAGLGATGPGVKGATFADVRTGIRAQVQHLKAYASTAALKNACVDPRFDLVTRGVAQNLTDLNGRWAVPGDGYGENIYKLVCNLLSV